MEAVTSQTYLGDILHVITQGLLAPDVIILILLIGYAIFSIGSILVEYFTERRHFKIVMSTFLSDLMNASQAELPTLILKSTLLNRQKVALLTVYDFRTLPREALVALIRRTISEQEYRLDHIVQRNSTAAKVAPMLGLMGTLIPLGPGIAALGTGDIAQLSGSIVIAFDTTVAGLAAAAVCLVIGKIRRSWYENYMGALESTMSTLLKKITVMQEAGEIQITEPTTFSTVYEEALQLKRTGSQRGFAERIHPRTRSKASSDRAQVQAELEAMYAQAGGFASAKDAVGQPQPQAASPSETLAIQPSRSGK